MALLAKQLESSLRVSEKSPTVNLPRTKDVASQYEVSKVFVRLLFLENVWKFGCLAF